MTSKKKTPVKKSVGKPKLKKETIRVLDAKRRSSDVKGGQVARKHYLSESCVAAC